MKRISCIFGQHWYKPSEIEFYLVEKKPNSNVYRSIAKCMYCGKTDEQLVEIQLHSPMRETVMTTTNEAISNYTAVVEQKGAKDEL